MHVFVACFDCDTLPLSERALSLDVIAATVQPRTAPPIVAEFSSLCSTCFTRLPMPCQVSHGPCRAASMEGRTVHTSIPPNSVPPGHLLSVPRAVLDAKSRSPKARKQTPRAGLCRPLINEALPQTARARFLGAGARRLLLAEQPIGSTSCHTCAQRSRSRRLGSPLRLDLRGSL